MMPIQLNFKPSFLLCALLALMSIGACGIVILLTLPWQVKLLLCLVIMAAGIYFILYHGLLLLPWSCIKLNINAKNQLQLIRRDGKLLDVAVQQNSVVTPYLTVLNTKMLDAAGVMRILTLHCVILPDAVEAERYRQLRVWLRWGHAK